jgi:hypothetical protein
MHLQSLRAFGEFSSERLIVLLVGHPPEKVDAVQLVENLHAHTIALLACYWMRDSQ